MWVKKILTLLVLFGGISGQSHAQSLNIEALAQGGFLIPHRPALIYLREGHSTGISLSITKKTLGNKEWHHHYQLPNPGIEIGLLNTGNKDELGTAYSLNRIIDLPLNARKNSHFNLRLGGGLGYLTKHFHKYDNVKNAAIGSNFNVSILLGVSAITSIKNIHVRTGLRIQHFSNGSFSKPNLGINIPTAFIACGFIKHKKVMEEDKSIGSRTLPSHQPQYSNHIIGALGTKSIGGEKNTLYGAWHIAYELRKRISPKFSWNAFTDLGYNNSHPAQLIKDGRASETFSNLLQLGAGMGLYNHFGNTAVFLQTGYYIQSQFLGNEGRIYNKFGVEHILNDRFRVQVLLKSHLAKADYFAIACVYTI